MAKRQQVIAQTPCSKSGCKSHAAVWLQLDVCMRHGVERLGKRGMDRLIQDALGITEFRASGRSNYFAVELSDSELQRTRDVSRQLGWAVESGS